MKKLLAWICFAGAAALGLYYVWNGLLLERVDTLTGVHSDGFGRRLSESMMGDWKTPAIAELWIEAIVWPAILALFAIGGWLKRPTA